MSDQYTVTVAKELALYVSDCPSCGVYFGITVALEARRRKDGQGFYCPNGHGLSFGKSEADKLKAQLEQSRADLARTRERLAAARRDEDAAQRSLSATRGHLTRMRKRVEAGVCPHCHRTFQGLARHMQNMHAEQLAADGLRVVPEKHTKGEGDDAAAH